MGQPRPPPRIAVFSVAVLHQERVVVVAEQKPNCSDEDAFSWMNSLVPAVESIHGINLYSIVLVNPGRLPKVSLSLSLSLSLSHSHIRTYRDPTG